MWHRFSWFGFRGIRKLCYPDGTQALATLPRNLITDARETIADMEALLILALGTQKRGNRHEMRFGLAERWEQVLLDERDIYLGRVEPDARTHVVPFENRTAFRAAVAQTRMP